jgi:hypothetical protein
MDDKIKKMDPMKTFLPSTGLTTKFSKKNYTIFFLKHLMWMRKARKKILEEEIDIESEEEEYTEEEAAEDNDLPTDD